MDAFEKARAKYEKNRANQGRPLPSVLSQVVDFKVEHDVSTEDTLPPVAPVPKEKTASKDAVIEVTVRLPDRVFSFTLTKRSIYANVHMSKININEFRKAIANGLEPLLGRVE